MKAFFLIGAVAKRPRPVRERPIRKALLRAISGMYDDSRPCNHIGPGARLISQPSPPGARAGAEFDEAEAHSARFALIASHRRSSNANSLCSRQLHASM